MNQEVSTSEEVFRLTVLNHGGRDATQVFANGAASPDDHGHPPVNFHAYAACTNGFFEDDWEKALARKTPVLLLLRRNLRSCLEALRRLKAAGVTVAVSFKETGLHQVASALSRANRIGMLREILELADGALAATPWLEQFYRDQAGTARNLPVEFLPTPYPVEETAWDFSRPWDQRRGVLIGTREFFTPSRCHLAALTTLRPLVAEGIAVSVCNFDGKRGRRLLEDLFGSGAPGVCISEERRPYAQYLRWISEHRVVFQLDQSRVPGQVAGDCLLTRTPCVGGDGAIERLTQPEIAGLTREMNLAELQALVRRLATDQAAWENAVQQALTRAREQVAYGVVARRLKRFFDRLMQF